MKHLWILLILTRMAVWAVEPHWAYAPLRSPQIPEAEAEVFQPVDAFIREQLQTRGLKPSPEADRSTLLRRIHWDLIGLPPSPSDYQRFLADESPQAYEREIDRLLASPRYGERWARHWMDVVHFAETHGHDQDRIREQAWPYRDYLVEAFNSDRPYGRFIEEQVAGDVLYPDRPEATVALGMIAAGPWDESSLRDIREDTLDRQLGRYVDRDDMISTVFSVFNSTTVHCARCHDHKFDPIPQTDYYALQAVFSASSARIGCLIGIRRSTSGGSVGCTSNVRWSGVMRSCWNRPRLATRCGSGRSSAVCGPRCGLSGRPRGFFGGQGHPPTAIRRLVSSQRKPARARHLHPDAIRRRASAESDSVGTLARRFAASSRPGSK